jgi:hypothetical protein
MARALGNRQPDAQAAWRPIRNRTESSGASRQRVFRLHLRPMTHGARIESRTRRNRPTRAAPHRWGLAGVEPMTGIEPASSRWKREALPLSDIGIES